MNAKTHSHNNQLTYNSFHHFSIAICKMSPKWAAILVLVTFHVSKVATQVVGHENVYPCAPRSYGDNNIVCVCNATYCDTTPGNLTQTPTPGAYNWYVSSKEGLRLEPRLGLQMISGSCDFEESISLYVNISIQHQTILGFGGAFTDSTGVNIESLSPATQDRLIKSYFHPVFGSNYNLGRLPIGGTDFSPRFYTLDDTPGDVTLQHFSLASEDILHKIPLIKRAIKLNPSIELIASPWTAPLWMKNTNQTHGYSFLLPQYYQTYANYIIKFLEAYQNNSINIFAVTTGNEPLNAFIPSLPVPSMAWSPSTLGNWIVNNLGPTLSSSRFNATQILALDDERMLLPLIIQLLFEISGVESYISGIAVHWYSDAYNRANILDNTHNYFPNQYILMTEASNGALITPHVILGSWERGESYILSIIEYVDNWSVGWMDWNLALNAEGGPTWTENYVDSPVIVNATADEFYHQPMYYAIKHFSRFVPRGSISVSITDWNHPIRSAAFLTPSQEVVVVIMNRADHALPVTVSDSSNNGSNICLTLPARSMNTIVYAV